MDRFSLNASTSHRIGYIATVASSLFPSMTPSVGSTHSVAKAACSPVFIASIDRDRFAWKGKERLGLSDGLEKFFVCAHLVQCRGRGAIPVIHLPFRLYHNAPCDHYYIRGTVTVRCLSACAQLVSTQFARVTLPISRSWRLDLPEEATMWTETCWGFPF